MNPTIEKNFKYHPPTPGTIEAHARIRAAARDYAQLVDDLLPQNAGREKASAITHIENSMFWACAGIVRHTEPETPLRASAKNFRTSLWSTAQLLAQQGPALSAREKTLLSFLEQLAEPAAPLRAESIDSLREKVRASALNDTRFNKAPVEAPDGCCSGVWVSDLMPPENGKGWMAIIQAMDGKLYQCPFVITDGQITLGDSSTEVTRTVSYAAVKAKAAAQSTDQAPLRAKQGQYGSLLDTIESSSVMFMPGGLHRITPGADQGSAELTVRINAKTADVLNGSLAAINQHMAPQRLYFDKDHQAVEATAWPEAFFWSETPQPGVYARVEYTALGKELIQGKMMRAFSPGFTTDAALPKKIARGKHVTVAEGKRGSNQNPAEVTGLTAPDCGTLTNYPAFKKILPLWANDRSAAGATENAAGARSS